MHIKRLLALENYYHAFNRGVDKRQIFMDDEDYRRFLHNMYEFNTPEKAPPYMNRKKGDSVSPSSSTIGHRKSNSQRIVEIVSFCLMPNHFHFILKPLVEGGLTLFMKKLGIGYVKYFNLKYERSGVLFQSRFKSVLVTSDSQMMHLARYIHILNPGELAEPKIREGIVENSAGLQEFIKNYKWSSYLDYIGQKNYPSLINKKLISGYFGSERKFEKFSLSWKNNDSSSLEYITIE